MTIPDKLTPFLIGAAIGALVLAVTGFAWAGWVTASKAEYLAGQRASSAVVGALVPVCLDAFRNDANAQQQREALLKVNEWARDDFVAKAGWATSPGTTTINMSMAKACADLIAKDQT